MRVNSKPFKKLLNGKITTYILYKKNIHNVKKTRNLIIYFTKERFNENSRLRNNYFSDIEVQFIAKMFQSP